MASTSQTDTSGKVAFGFESTISNYKNTKYKPVGSFTGHYIGSDHPNRLTQLGERDILASAPFTIYIYDIYDIYDIFTIYIAYFSIDFIGKILTLIDKLKRVICKSPFMFTLLANDKNYLSFSTMKSTDCSRARQRESGVVLKAHWSQSPKNERLYRISQPGNSCVRRFLCLLTRKP